jgi:glycine cleavage system H protein
MADIPNNLKFLESHEWAREEDDGSVTVGISDHAQSLLGDIVFVELPEVGSEVNKQDDVAVVESVKAASDVYTPLSGEVLEVNEMLTDRPEVINSSPY